MFLLHVRAHGRNIRLMHWLYCCAFVVLLFSCARKNEFDYTEDGSFYTQLAKADNLIDSGRPKEAFSLLDAAARGRKDLSMKDRFKYYMFYCGYYTKYSKEYDKAIDYIDSLSALVQKADKGQFTREAAEIKYALGDILFRQQKYSEAYQAYFSAKLIGKNSLDPCNLADYSYRMGMILYKQSRYLAAKSYFAQSLRETNTCAEDNFTYVYRRQELLNNMALCFYRSEMLDSSLVFYDKALTYVTKFEHNFPEKRLYMKMAKGVIYGNQAQIYSRKKQYKLAEELFIKSIAINTQPGYDHKDAHFSQLHLAELYINTGDKMAAHDLLTQVKASNQLLYNEEVALEWERLMWKYHQLNQDPVNAYNYLYSYTTLRDSIAKRVKGLTGSDVDEQLKTLESQYDYRIANREKDSYLKIAIVVSVSSLVIIILIVWNWRRSRNSVKSLTGLNNQVLEQKLRLEQTLGELEKQGKEKDRILRAVAHDLRNPVGGVASVASLLLDEKDLTEEQVEMISLVHSTCLDALQLINEILELATIDHTINLTKERVDINMLISNATDLLRFKADEKQQKLIINGLEVPKYVSINREKISRVVSNLISNAIKFSPNGGDINIRIAEKSGNVEFSIQDHGIGIPDAMKDRIFDTFTEAKRLGTSGEKPFGLGLSISKQIVEAHEGAIRLESEVGKGSTFYVKLRQG